jgi:ribosomal protein S18 acetylase RimI-like enzyme
MASVRERAYAGVADLRRMQDAASARFGRGLEHVGDLAWGVRNNSHLELGRMVTLLESAAGELLGWTWFSADGWFEAVAVVDEPQLGEALAAAVAATVERAIGAGDVVDKVSVLCDDRHESLAAALLARGFVRLDEELEITRRGLAGLPEPAVPDGLRFAGLDDEALVEAKVEAHRAAFAPSSLTLPMYQRARRTWPYRGELDRVVVDGEGRVLAACLGWLDPGNGWGLLEPVGTRPEHRRRGLAAAVCLDALHALRRAGAHAAQVACESGEAGCATYHSLGFVTERRMGILRRT